MKKDLKYISILVGCTLLYVIMEIVTPKPIDWSISLASLDKNPFGTYLLDQRLEDLFQKQTKSNATLYELQDSAYQNLFVIARQFAPGDEDVGVLLNHVSEGNSILIEASYFSGKFADTLNLDTEDYLFQGALFENLEREDTASLSFVHPGFGEKEYFYQRSNTQYYFSEFDSTKAHVVAVNDLERPVLLRIPWGEGNLFIGSTPLAFTNNYLVYKDNYEFVSNAFSYLPGNELHWTEYYQLGRMEARTPLRFILSAEGLRWAYYITIITVLLFMVFEAKRKQRIIPVIEPLRNETLDFVGTISNLYYQNKAHKSIAEKKINFFLDRLRNHYYLSSESDPNYLDKVASKLGEDKEDIVTLFNLINEIKRSDHITEAQLMALNKKIEAIKY